MLPLLEFILQGSCRVYACSLPPACGTLLRPAPADVQEPEGIIKLPSLPRLATLHSLPNFARAVFPEDALSAPGVALAVGDTTARETTGAMTAQPDLACQADDAAAAAIQRPLGFCANARKAPHQVTLETKLDQTCGRSGARRIQSLRVQAW